jgi:hypothetical protein
MMSPSRFDKRGHRAGGFADHRPSQSPIKTVPGVTPGTGAKGYVQPRTPDGQPDLTGFWTNSTYVPLERPKNVTKEFYTPEEVAKMEKEAAAREDEQTVPGTAADVHYDGTQFGLGRSQGTYGPAHEPDHGSAGRAGTAAHPERTAATRRPQRSEETAKHQLVQRRAPKRPL